MRQVSLFKALRPVACSKRLRQERANRALDRDIDTVYAALLERAQAHNVARGIYAPRASPVVH